MRPVPLPRSLPLLACLLTTLVAACSGQEQKDGLYRFEALEVFRDDCQLLASPEALWDGELLLSGRVIRMNYGLLDMQLIGSFLESSLLEKSANFTLDGSVANVTARTNGQECLLDQVSMHLEGVTECPGEFTGSLRVRYEARRPDSCVCELGTRYRAVHESGGCGD